MSDPNSFVETPRGAPESSRPGFIARRGRCMAVVTALLATAAAVWYARTRPEEVIVTGADITSARQLTQGDYEYPEALWDAQIEGEVILRVLVSAAGGVDSVRVERSSGYAEFDSVARSGARGLSFAPFTYDGVPGDEWVLLPVSFDMDDHR